MIVILCITKEINNTNDRIVFGSTINIHLKTAHYFKLYFWE